MGLTREVSGELVAVPQEPPMGVGGRGEWGGVRGRACERGQWEG